MKVWVTATALGVMSLWGLWVQHGVSVASAQDVPQVTDVVDIDWSLAREELTRVMRGYLAVDTSNPPGREAAAVAYLGDLLTAEGIAWTSHAFAPGRENIVARIRASGTGPHEAPLCLMSHLDVATAEAEAWVHPPFSGHLDEDGYIWGRGAIDMKSLGIVELMTLVWIHRLEIPLNRDLILLGVGDEEVDGAGAKYLIEHHWEDIGCSHLINEGGLGVRDALVDGVTTFGISYTEKGALWVKMIASGEPGHGSTPTGEEATVRLMRALQRLERRKPRPKIPEGVYSLLHAVGEQAKGVTGGVLKRPGLVRLLAMRKILDNPLSRAMVTDTVNVTGFGGAEKPNVVPSEVWAQLDIRLLPGTEKDEMLEELAALVDDPKVRFEVLHFAPPAVSSMDDPVFQAFVANLERSFPGAAVGPLVMPGTTDSALFRPLGVQAYGMAPFVFELDDLRGMHGHDEKIRATNLESGLRVFLGAVLDVSRVATSK